MSAIKTNMTREAYRKAIVTDGKSIGQLAKQRGITCKDVRKEIHSLYERAAWADKLIGVAEANEAKQAKAKKKRVAQKKGKKAVLKADSSYHKQREEDYAWACQKGIAIIDSSFAIDRFEHCKNIGKIIIPKFCLGEMRAIASNRQGEEKEKVEKKIRYFEENAEVVFVEKLPGLDRYYVKGDFKNRSIMFARYVKYIWQSRGADIPCLTRAFEANRLIEEYITL